MSNEFTPNEEFRANFIKFTEEQPEASVGADIVVRFPQASIARRSQGQNRQPEGFDPDAFRDGIETNWALKL